MSSSSYPPSSPLSPTTLVAVFCPPALQFHREELYISLILSAGYTIIQRELRILKPAEIQSLLLNDSHQQKQFNLPKDTFHTNNSSDPSLLLLLQYSPSAATSASSSLVSSISPTTTTTSSDAYSHFSLSLRPHLEYVYSSLTPYMALRDTFLLFSSSTHASPYGDNLLQPIEYAYLMISNDGESGPWVSEVIRELEGTCDFCVIGRREITLSQYPKIQNKILLSSSASASPPPSTYSFIVLERVNALSLLHFVIGPNDILCDSESKWGVTEGTIRGKYSKNTFYVPSNIDEIYEDIDTIFPLGTVSNPFETSSLFVFLSFSPTRMAPSALSDFLSLLGLYRFTVMGVEGMGKWGRGEYEELIGKYIQNNTNDSSTPSDILSFVYSSSTQNHNSTSLLLYLDRINGPNQFATLLKIYERHHAKYRKYVDGIGRVEDQNYFIYYTPNITQTNRSITRYFPNIPLTHSSSLLSSITPNTISSYLTTTLLKGNITLSSVLVDGLSHICKFKYPDPLVAIEEMGKYLRDNNPNRPKMMKSEKEIEEERIKVKKESEKESVMIEEGKTGIIGRDGHGSGKDIPIAHHQYIFVLSTNPLPTPLSSHLTPLSSTSPSSSTEFINIHDLLSSFATHYPVYRNDCISHMKFIRTVNTDILIKLIVESVRNHSQNDKNNKNKTFYLLNYPWTMDSCLQFEKCLGIAPTKVIEVKSEGWAKNGSVKQEESKESESKENGVSMFSDDKERKSRLLSVCDDLKEVEEHYKLFGKWNQIKMKSEAAETIREIVKSSQ